MKEYIIVSHAERTIVEAEVSRRLNEGWQLAGGVSMVYKHEPEAHVHGHLVYAQAMEKATA